MSRFRVVQGRKALDSDVRPQPWLHAGGGRRAGARHRREHGDLLDRERGAPEAGAVSRARSARRLSADVARGRVQRRLAGEVPVLARADQRRPARLGLSLEHRQPDRRRHSRAASRQPGVGRLLPPVRRADAAGPWLHRRRGSSRRRARRRAQPCALDATFRRRSPHHRQDHLAQRRALHDHRDRRSDIRCLGVRAVSRCLDPLPARSAHQRSGPLLLGRGPIEAGRLARPGAGAPGAVGRRVQAASIRTHCNMAADSGSSV